MNNIAMNKILEFAKLGIKAKYGKNKKDADKLIKIIEDYEHEIIEIDCPDCGGDGINHGDRRALDPRYITPCLTCKDGKDGKVKAIIIKE